MAFHPARCKTLVFAGDKWGKIGIWDVVRTKSSFDLHFWSYQRDTLQTHWLLGWRRWRPRHLATNWAMQRTRHWSTHWLKVAEVEAEALADTLGDVYAEALVDKLADALADGDADTVADKLGDIEIETLVDTLADKLAEVEGETLADTGHQRPLDLASASASWALEVRISKVTVSFRFQNWSNIQVKMPLLANKPFCFVNVQFFRIIFKALVVGLRLPFFPLHYKMIEQAFIIKGLRKVTILSSRTHT